MLYRLLADCVVIIHAVFVLFVVLGGFVALRYRRCIWIHVPSFVWGGVISLAGWVCPLTPLENWLREKGGGAAYETGFVEHYVVPILYPSALTRNVQIGLGILVFALNAAVYSYMLFRFRKIGADRRS